MPERASSATTEPSAFDRYSESPERARLYAEKHALPLEVYFDKKGNAADAYDAAATSYIVVLDKTGTVVYTGLGGSQNIDAAIRKAIGG